MSPATRGRLLVASAAGLAAAVPLLAVWPVGTSPPQPVPIILAAVPRVRLSLTGAATNRPLFAPDPAAAPASLPGDATASQAKPPRLAGVIAGRGRAVALLRGAAGTVLVKPGDEVDGWSVTAVGPTSATVTSGDRQEVLEVQVAPAKAAGAGGVANGLADASSIGPSR